MEPSHAVQIDRYGPPEVLALRPVGLPVLAADEVRVTTVAAAVNRADVEIRSGHWPVQLAEAAEVHRRMEAGALTGRALLVP